MDGYQSYNKEELLDELLKVQADNVKLGNKNYELLIECGNSFPLVNNNSGKLMAIDLFAGIGGFRQALNDNKISCVFSSEWDKEAQYVYKQNFGELPFGDITKISAEQIPSHDILCGGFPCQAFSISGKQNGFNDTRGTLFFDVCRIVEFHKPKVVFLENVKNLVSHDGGKTFKVIQSSLDELGYNVFYDVINSANLGVATSRERVYIVCFRKDLGIKTFKFPSQNKNTTFKVVSDILDTDNVNDCIINRNDIVINKPLKRDIIKKITNPPKPIRIGKINKGGQGERIYSPYGTAITFSAYGGGAGSKTGAYYINGKVRKLTPRECARAMGFPENFKIHHKRNQAYKQFGNSVAVPVISAILKEIKKVWLKVDHK